MKIELIRDGETHSRVKMLPGDELIIDLGGKKYQIGTYAGERFKLSALPTNDGRNNSINIEVKSVGSIIID